MDVKSNNTDRYQQIVTTLPRSYELSFLGWLVKQLATHPEFLAKIVTPHRKNTFLSSSRHH